MRFNICLAAVAATLAASPALAQSFPTDTAQANAKGVVLQTHKLLNNGDLDFGIVTTDGVTNGTVVIESSAAGIRTSTGGVMLLPSPSRAAEFDGLAAPHETVVLTLTLPTGNVLQDVSQTHTVDVNSLTVDAAGLTRQADANGNFTVYVGGDFGLSATQAPGVYSGQFQLTAEYQ
jgi:hypothetical protein